MYKQKVLVYLSLFLVPEIIQGDYLRILFHTATPAVIVPYQTSTIKISIEEYVTWGGYWGGTGWTEKPKVIINIADRPILPKCVYSYIAPVGQEWFWIPFLGWVLLYNYQYSWWRYKGEWNGTDRYGRPVPPGKYTYTIEAWFTFGYDKKKGEIKVISPITICDSLWQPLEWNKILKVGDTLYLQAATAEGNPKLQEIIQVLVKTNITNPQGIKVTLTETGLDTNLFRGTLKITEDLVRKGEDGIDEFASADTTEPFDSDAFAEGMHPKKNMGEARKEGDEKKMIPPVSKEFMQAGGVEKITAIYENSSDTAFVKNQADWFYFSGHGYHSLESIEITGGELFSPNDTIGHWNEDLRVIILSACSILDVNDYNGNFDDDGDEEPEVGPKEKVFPGEKWANTGPCYFLGYNSLAPGGPYVDTAIIKKWLSYLPDKGIVQAWIEANYDYAAYNYAVIDPQGYWYCYHRYNPIKKRTDYVKMGPIPKTQW